MPANQEGVASFGSSFPLQPQFLQISNELLSDLRAWPRLTRWPLSAGHDDWYYGVDRAYLEEVFDY